MKFKYLFFIATFCLFSGISFAQEKKFNFTEREHFTIEISLPDNYWQTLKNKSLKVKVTNKFGKEINKKVFRIIFIFPVCPKQQQRSALEAVKSL